MRRLRVKGTTGNSKRYKADRIRYLGSGMKGGKPYIRALVGSRVVEKEVTLSQLIKLQAMK